MKTVKGIVIVHPDGRAELAYFDGKRFSGGKQRKPGIKDFLDTYRPDCTAHYATIVVDSTVLASGHRAKVVDSKTVSKRRWNKAASGGEGGSWPENG